MARPREYDADERQHMGTRFNKYLITLFDDIRIRQGLSRTQALTWLVSNAVRDGRIPVYAEEVRPMIEQRKLLERQEQLIQQQKLLEGRQVPAHRSRLSGGPTVGEKTGSKKRGTEQTV